MKKILCSFITLLLLISCGGGGSDNQTNDNTQLVDKNVALTSNGGTATATYDNGSARFVNDEDTSTSNYWAGNITNDSVTVDLGSIFQVKKIIIYTNDTSFSSTNPSKVIEVSSDNSNWSTTGNLFGGDIPCPTASAGNGKIVCEYFSEQSFRYIRVTITASQNIGLINLHEIEVIAKVNE